MRELKFRAWDKIDKKYIIPDRLALDDDGALDFYIYNSGGYALECFIVEQYTGLKDKNGKEIYEGDIVQTNYMNAKGWVVWTDGAWDICLSGYSFELFLAEEVGVGCEVIGNIHENPDLMKEAA